MGVLFFIIDSKHLPRRDLALGVDYVKVKSGVWNAFVEWYDAIAPIIFSSSLGYLPKFLTPSVNLQPAVCFNSAIITSDLIDTLM